MNLKLITTTFILLIFNIGLSQNTSEKVYIETLQEGNYLVFKCYNTSPFPVIVKLNLYKVKNLTGNINPRKATVKSNSDIILTKLKMNTKQAQYAYKLEKSFPDEVIQSKEISLDDDYNLNKGIIVFNKDSCPRCNYTTNYLIENEIDFKYFNIKEEENNRLMWRMLRENDKNISSLTTPVILVDGKLSHSHKDLKKFVEKLR